MLKGLCFNKTCVNLAKKLTCQRTKKSLLTALPHKYGGLFYKKWTNGEQHAIYGLLLSVCTAWKSQKEGCS